jgi:hypothetical protein
MQILFVRQDELRSYQRGGNPSALLHDAQRVIYPVSVGGAVRSSATLENRGGTWVPSALGRPNLARLVDWTRRQVKATRAAAPANMMLVEAPSVGARFVGHAEGAALFLTPIVDVPGTSLSAGVTVTADEALSQLVPLAQRDMTGVVN